MPTLRKMLLRSMAVAGLGAAAITAHAADFSVSGFGTVGYAQSDQPEKYQRFINDQGTFKRDSVFGVQVDATFNPQWGATIQAKLAPASGNDREWDTTVSWAFISYRPDNDWLLRLGKLRVPLYLNSENMDVGTTFDFARLPAEMYSITPSSDFTGASFSRNWNLDNGDLTLDGYWGQANMHWRFYQRDPIPGTNGPGPLFVPIRTEAKGLVLTLRQDENVFRAGFHDARAERRDGVQLPVNFPFVSIGPGMGYYQVPGLPGPGITTIPEVKNTILNVGADVSLGSGYRLMAEYARRIVKNMDIGPDTQGGYVALSRRIGAWTPYVSVAALRSEDKPLSIYKNLNGTSVPGFIPGAPMINAAQRAGADGVVAYDQSSFALGTSYSVSATAKIKAEWMHTRVGQASSFVDPAPGGDSAHKRINTVSFSYNFVF